MATVNENTIPDLNPNNNLDALCQEFDGVSFYGLEYIVDDFFQRLTVKSSVSNRPSVDWFGLYD